MLRSKLGGELLERQRLLSEKLQQLETSIMSLQAQITTLQMNAAHARTEGTLGSKG